MYCPVVQKLTDFLEEHTLYSHPVCLHRLSFSAYGNMFNYVVRLKFLMYINVSFLSTHVYVCEVMATMLQLRQQNYLSPIQIDMYERDEVLTMLNLQVMIFKECILLC
jgi:hypothetical protein